MLWVFKNRIGNYEHAANLPIISLQDRVDKVLETPRSQDECECQNEREKRATKLYTDIPAEEIVLELHQPWQNFTCKQRKDVLQEKLSNLMHGIQRLPALLFENPKASLKDLSLERYEISAIEPMHGIGNHIKNLYEEIPSHFPKTIQQAIKNVLQTSFRGKTRLSFKSCDVG